MVEEQKKRKGEEKDAKVGRRVKGSSKETKDRVRFRPWRWWA
jgi:hypothetical protein